MYTSVRKCIHSSPNMKIFLLSYVPINRKMDFLKTLMYSYTFTHGVPCSNKREQTPCNNVDAPQEHHAEQKRTNTKNTYCTISLI